MLHWIKDSGEWAKETYQKEKWKALYAKCGGDSIPNWNGAKGYLPD